MASIHDNQESLEHSSLCMAPQGSAPVCSPTPSPPRLLQSQTCHHPLPVTPSQSGGAGGGHPALPAASGTSGCCCSSRESRARQCVPPWHSGPPRHTPLQERDHQWVAVPCQLSHVPVVLVLTEAEGLAGAPEGARGVAADEPAGALQLVSRGAAETGVPTRMQAADRDLPESRPCREGAAQQVG